MTRTIEIDQNSGIARLIERAVVAEVPVASLSEYMEVRMPSIFPILPDHTRVVAFDPDSKKGIVIIEQTPARHRLTVHYDNGEYQTTAQDYQRRDKTTNRAVFNIQFPYQYFAYAFQLNTRGDQWNGMNAALADFTIEQGILMWRPTRLNKMSDELWPAKLWNVRNSGICWGGGTFETGSMAERLDDMVKTFPATEFTPHYGNPVPAPYRDYTDWEKASEGVKGATCYTEWDHFKNEAPLYTVQKFIDKHLAKNLTVADTEHVTVNIPEPPRMFTIGKMIEYFDTLPDNHKARFLQSLNRYIEGKPNLLDEAPAEVVVAKTVAKTDKKTTVAKGVKVDDDSEEVDIPGVGKVTVKRTKDAQPNG